MNKWLAGFVGIAVVLAAVLGFVWRGRDLETTDDASIDADVVRIVAPAAGRIRTSLAREHARVKKGDVLFELDDRSLRAKLEATEAELVEAESHAHEAVLEADAALTTAPGADAALRAMVGGSSSAVDSARADASRARSAVAHAEADAELARTRLARTEELVKAGAGATASLDDAKNEAKRAEATLAEARSNAEAGDARARAAAIHVAEARGHLAEVTPANTRIELSRVRAEAAAARVNAAKAAVASVRAELDDMRVLAPVDGEIANVTSFAGSTVSANEPLAVLVPAPFYVTANFRETQIANVREGMTVDVEVDAFSGHPLKGRVESRSPGTGTRFSALHADNASGNFVRVVQRVPVRIALLENPPELRAGLSATVAVKTH